jgi:hypothetical protein
VAGEVKRLALWFCRGRYDAATKRNDDAVAVWWWRQVERFGGGW